MFCEDQVLACPYGEGGRSRRILDTRATVYRARATSDPDMHRWFGRADSDCNCSARHGTRHKMTHVVTAELDASGRGLKVKSLWATPSSRPDAALKMKKSSSFLSMIAMDDSMSDGTMRGGHLILLANQSEMLDEVRALSR